MARALALAIPLALVLGLGSVGAASAQSAIHATSDALYVGARAEPGSAWNFAYDLDILVTEPDVGISIGPSISVAFGGESSTDLGRRQEWLIAADIVRLRVTLGQIHGFRGMALVGGGMTLVSLYDQSTPPHDAQLDDGTTVTVVDHHPSLLAPGALMTLGVGADWYFDSQWGLAAFLVGHIRLDDQNRMPAVWVELGVGMRFGE